MIMERKHIAQEFLKKISNIKEDLEEHGDYQGSYSDLLYISERVVAALNGFMDLPKNEVH